MGRADQSSDSGILSTGKERDHERNKEVYQADHGVAERRGAGDKGSSRTHRLPSSGSGSRIAPRRLRRSAPRSASVDGQLHPPRPCVRYTALWRVLRCPAHLITPRAGAITETGKAITETRHLITPRAGAVRNPKAYSYLCPMSGSGREAGAATAQYRRAQ